MDYHNLHLAWAQHPPVDWLAAAYLKYKAPTKWKDALENTRRMGEMLKLAGATVGIRGR